MARTKDEADVAERVIDRTTRSAHVTIKESTGTSGAPGAERRVKTRFAASLKVTLVGEHNFYVGLSENLSEGGIFVQTQNALPIGTTIRVDFTLPTSGDAFSIVGQVRWVRLPDAVREEHNNYGGGAASGDARKAGMGIQFLAMTPETSSAITKFITIRNPEFYTE